MVHQHHPRHHVRLAQADSHSLGGMGCRYHHVIECRIRIESQLPQEAAARQGKGTSEGELTEAQLDKEVVCTKEGTSTERATRGAHDEWLRACACGCVWICECTFHVLKIFLPKLGASKQAARQGRLDDEQTQGKGI